MKKKIFITGGGGMLSSRIESFYTQKDYAVLAPTHAQLDVLNGPLVKETMKRFGPDCVFHTAALHVDACEENPELAYRLNSWSSYNIATMCRELNCDLIYISTCGLFADEIKYYSEYDPVVLKTTYARSKYNGEALSLSECKKTFAIRPGWLFGGDIQQKKNFVFQRYKEAVQFRSIKAAQDKFGCPTFIDDLVAKIDEIIETKNPGLYHVTNSGGCSRFEYIKEIIEACKLMTEVIPVDSKHFPRKANVPSSELLNNWNMKFLGLRAMPSWKDAIGRYVKTMLKEV